MTIWKYVTDDISQNSQTSNTWTPRAQSEAVPVNQCSLIHPRTSQRARSRNRNRRDDDEGELADSEIDPPTRSPHLANLTQPRSEQENLLAVNRSHFPFCWFLIDRVFSAKFVAIACV